VMIEEYIRGTEATCGVIDGFRGVDRYALLPVEIVSPKYPGVSQELCPGRFSDEESKEIQRHAVLAHDALGSRHYSRSDFIISRNGIYALEVNTLPSLTPESLFPKSLEAVGSSLPEFLDHIICLALR